jgi:hypothetical protein
MRFLTSRIRVCGNSSKNDKVDVELGPGELGKLLEIYADGIFATDGGGRFICDPQSNDAVSVTVGNPEWPDPRTAVHVAEHIVVILVPIDQPDGGEDALGWDQELLEHGAALPADNDPTLNECQRRGDLFPVALNDPNGNLSQIFQSVSVGSSKMEASAKWGTSKSKVTSHCEAGMIRGYKTRKADQKTHRRHRDVRCCSVWATLNMCVSSDRSTKKIWLSGATASGGTRQKDGFLPDQCDGRRFDGIWRRGLGHQARCFAFEGYDIVEVRNNVGITCRRKTDLRIDWRWLRLDR